jgi:hypothetical protein
MWNVAGILIYNESKSHPTRWDLLGLWRTLFNKIFVISAHIDQELMRQKESSK